MFFVSIIAQVFCCCGYGFNLSNCWIEYVDFFIIIICVLSSTPSAPEVSKREIRSKGKDRRGGRMRLGENLTRWAFAHFNLNEICLIFIKILVNWFRVLDVNFRERKISLKLNLYEHYRLWNEWNYNVMTKKLRG